MKKILSALLAGAMMLSLAACGGTTEPSQSEPAPSESESVSEPASEPAPEAPVEGAGLKTGMATINNLTVSEDKAEVNSVVAAVLVDADGKLVACQLDEAQTKPSFENGVIKEVEDLRTKTEKQGDYGMLSASPIGKEWFEQVDFLLNYVIGKTADEIAAIELVEKKPAEGSDLAAGCTIEADIHINAIVAAMKNAADLGAKAGDKLGLAVTTGKFYESNETNLQYDSDFAVVTVGADGKVSSCLIDAAQGKLGMADGKFTAVSGSYLSKKDLKEDYGMTGASPIGKEWYQQAAAYEAYALGKTADEITATELTDGAPTAGTDLAAGCTITMTSILANTVKAITSAK